MDTYRKQLQSDDAALILTILWQESSYISDRDAESIGFSRSPSRAGITQHGIAVALAKDRGELATISSRVRRVSLAAAAYGLIERNVRAYHTAIPLRGTELLHNFMTRVVSETVRAVSRNTKDWNLDLGGNFGEQNSLKTDDAPMRQFEQTESGEVFDIAMATDALDAGINELLAVTQRAVKTTNERGNEIDAMLDKIREMKASGIAYGPANS
jgi:hypothetical protein